MGSAVAVSRFFFGKKRRKEKTKKKKRRKDISPVATGDKATRLDCAAFEKAGETFLLCMAVFIFHTVAVFFRDYALFLRYATRSFPP